MVNSTEHTANQRYIVGITGASGSIYGIRLTEVLLSLGYTVHLVISNAGWRVLKEEMDWEASSREEMLEQYFSTWSAQLVYHSFADIGATIASGSFRVKAMIIVPCSMGTLANIAGGMSANLMTRAADVVLKEERKLVIVPRETPLQAIHLENMLKLARMGVSIVPAMPAFYYRPKTLDDTVDFMVGKVLDILDIEHQLFERWGNGREKF
ncbi:flavin prenyltransferase UbiX [Paenibacillus sp. PK4536]|uniref:UbiX family flavin prenyltransferase n=1 Tax=Paenibacillus sp. PK4536 TaxID=3024576 RepID=UPI0008477B43|nr:MULTISPECIES: flavin prenyltransferase UbiX [Paenibacillus]TKJ94383.1 UbiX family flavin prenyltransferase [Paenibacillus sp. CFBP13512]WIM38787.1 flavin prenyltransferase UbiX [Paenibacillus sp. PK4536]